MNERYIDISFDAENVYIESKHGKIYVELRVTPADIEEIYAAIKDHLGAKGVGA